MKTFKKSFKTVFLALVSSLLCNTHAQALTVYVSSSGSDVVEAYNSSGIGAAFAGVSTPEGIAADTNGNIYVATFYNDTIVKLTPSGQVTVFANSGLSNPLGIAFDSSGNLYAANWGNNTIEKFNSNGQGTVFASTGLNGPYGLAFDTSGNLYVANQYSDNIMKFNPSGQGTIFATNTQDQPAGLAFDSSGNLYVAIMAKNVIEKFNSSGQGSVFATASDNPIGLAFDDNGNLYVANYWNNTIEKFDPNGNGTVFASTGVNEPGFLMVVSTCTAKATATVVDGFVVAATITDGGCGYTNAPLVGIVGGGGTGATATAVVSNDLVVGITITDAGIGYTSTPTIYIYFPLAITGQPQSAVVNAYDTASFNVTTSGGAGLLSYQWSFNSTNIPGATTSTLTVSNVTPCDLGTYAVAVTDYFGSQTSSNATLSMYPSIVTPFTGGVEYWGMNVNFSVEAWGTGPLTYQWFDNGAAILNATNETLTLNDIQFTNAGLYTVVVGNSFGSATNSPAQVVVNPAGVSMGLYPGVTISGVVGNNYIIQRTPNLGDTNSWVTTANVTLTQPVQLWVNTNINASLPANPQNYYRVLPGP